MLSQNFIDWWFSPWDYAGSPFISGSGVAATDRLGQRDSYRLWCGQAHVVADLPPSFDPSWESAANMSGAALSATARLFAGLIAARENNNALLSSLSFVDRKWCLSVAATQPVRRCHINEPNLNQSIEIIGLIELALHLNHGFPGMWSRLRTTLPETDTIVLDPTVGTTRTDSALMNAAATRAQRCWRMCRNRVATETELAQSMPMSLAA